MPGVYLARAGKSWWGRRGGGIKKVVARGATGEKGEEEGRLMGLKGGEGGDEGRIQKGMASTNGGRGQKEKVR